MIRRLLLSLSARALGKRSAPAQRERILTKTREMRRQMGLPADARLGA
jgi:hypothetical protein